MKTIGIIGGMSWESTITYYKRINELVRDKLGGLHSAKIVLTSVEFDEIEALQREGNWDKAADILADCAKGLEAAGAQCVLIATNTMHLCAPKDAAAVTIPLLHIADATAARAHELQLSKLALLGTRYTMEGDFLISRLQKAGLDILVPDQNERHEVNRIIFDELCCGTVKEESRAFLKQVISRLVEDGAQGVILGCTELDLIVRACDAPVPLVDTTESHVRAAVNFAFS